MELQSAQVRDAAQQSKAWPFAEANRLLERIEAQHENKEFVVFETGYGPSGLPHIGTFGEVARTAMVRNAFEVLSDRPTKLICFSDDMDGFRKVPQGLPNQEMLAEDLGLPLSRVRDPFGQFDSFAAHNNAKLCSFLDSFGFEYEFLSSTECYGTGQFDEMLLKVLDCFDEILAIILPTLGGVSVNRKESYSPFLPVSPKSGRVLQVPTLERNRAKGTIVYEEPDGEKIEVPVTGGHVKLQWKPDWAMRWAALSVDYEMYGKDLIPSADLGGRICRALGAPPPVNMAFELFLDSEGQKISKSRGGGGVTIADWLSYAPMESLSMFMYQKPKTAKRLTLDLIPKSVDEYHQHIRALPGQNLSAQLNNPAWHVHAGRPPMSTMSLSYSMLLNLVSVSSAEDPDILWGFINKYDKNASPEANPDLSACVPGAIRFYQDQVYPSRQLRTPNPTERAAFEDLRSRLLNWAGEPDAEKLQELVYHIGKTHKFEPLRNWFKAIYEVLFGASQGPRFGGFIALYGVQETAELINLRINA